MLTKSCLNNIHSCFCLRPKAKELGIAQVVVFLVVGFFVSKTHATPLSLYFYFFIFSFFLFCLSPYLAIIILYMSTYLGLPTYQHIPTYVNLPTPTNIPTFLYQHTYLGTHVFLPTHTNPCLLTIIYLPTCTNP